MKKRAPRGAGAARGIERFRVPPGRRLKLDRWPTRVRPLYRDEEDAEAQLARQVARTSELQERLYADNRHALLVIFQAMDAAGKDGAIQRVFSGVNPAGCQVSSFKQPSAEELDHDFLWRTALRLPERGRIGIFNRSYYEEVLVVRVHPEYLAAQRLPPTKGGAGQFWKQRLASIREHEAHLQRNGTVVLKFFLHVSKDEQRQRFLDRIEHPEKNWKFNLGDVEERQYWNDYMQAYEAALPATSTRESPWYAVPADDKKNARLIVSQVLNATLEAMDPQYPRPDPRRVAELKSARRLLGD